MRKNDNIDTFNNWLSGLNLSVKPSLKINHGFTTATVVVDFGSPKEPLHISSELNGEICSRMKDLTTSLTGKRNVRINVDNSNGVFWSNVQ